MTNDWSLEHTFIKGRRIDIEPGRPVVLHFKCGRKGDDEAGDYCFWTAKSGKSVVTKRCRKGTDPGEPFLEMIETKEENWEIAASAEKIRPALAKGLRNWLRRSDKSADAKCAVGEICWIGNRAWRVERTAEGGFDLVPERAAD